MFHTYKTTMTFGITIAQSSCYLSCHSCKPTSVRSQFGRKRVCRQKPWHQLSKNLFPFTTLDSLPSWGGSDHIFFRRRRLYLSYISKTSEPLIEVASFCLGFTRSTFLASSTNFWFARIRLNSSSSEADLTTIPLFLVADPAELTGLISRAMTACLVLAEEELAYILCLSQLASYNRLRLWFIPLVGAENYGMFWGVQRTL